MTGILPIWRGLAATFSDAHRQCGLLKVSNDRDACLAKARINYAKKRIEVMTKALGKCGETKNPERCKSLLSKNIQKDKVKLQKEESKLQSLAQKGRAYSQDPAQLVARK